jgi:diaminohydroxyphosphoribosylaminopyrimidine deaminase/5-amino-6-(5-phosphoribosylamino)uracil reductase
MAAASDDFDTAMLRRAINLAMNGRGAVEPNPMVGCVIVKDGRVIGEGYHEKFGGPHAEPNALAACTESPQGATAYVTLEPCCHANKKTPPCAPRLIEAKIARVVVGCLDPNPEVNGKGLAKLRAARIEVAGPVLEDEAKQLIAPFLARVNHGRPYVTLKWAESADGKIAGPGGKRVQISNRSSSALIHQLRARCDAIMVGINTVLCDDPMLTVRGAATQRPLLRVVLDRNLRIPLESRLVQTARENSLLVGCGVAVLESANPRLGALRDQGVAVFPVPFLERALIALATQQVTHLVVEPGPTLARSFFEADIADRLWVIRSPNVIGDASAPGAAAVPTHFVETGRMDVDGDTLSEYLNPRSPAYFGPFLSADFVLAGRGEPCVRPALL